MGNTLSGSINLNFSSSFPFFSLSKQAYSHVYNSWSNEDGIYQFGANSCPQESTGTAAVASPYRKGVVRRTAPCIRLPITSPPGTTIV